VTGQAKRQPHRSNSPRPSATASADAAATAGRTILQRQGTVLAVSYLSTLDRVSPAQVAEATRLANVVGRWMLKPSA
jgi:hypothetical protein